MTYIPDLSIYAYWGLPYGPIYSIGWLDGSEPYTQGKAPLALLEKMKGWAENVKETAIMWTRGLHFSNLKEVEEILNDYTPEVFSFEKTYALNNGEFHVHYKGKFYAAPVMIFDYIMKNNYLPPEEYIEAVIYGELVTEANKEHFVEVTNEIIEGKFDLANQELDSGNFQASLQTINEMLTILPTEPLFFALRGTVYFKMGELEKARADLEYRLKPLKEGGGQNYAHVLAHLGKIEHLQGNKEKAKALLQEAVDIDPKNQEAKDWLVELD